MRPGLRCLPTVTDDVGFRKLRPVQGGVFGPARSGLEDAVTAERCERIGTFKSC